MARLFIPQVGNQLKLTENWDCKVFNEYRNKKVFDGLNIDTSGEERRNTNIDISFPKGTVLKVDRLYVRAPASSFDSITFSIVSCPIKALNKARFWVKLMDANKIEFEEIVLNMDFYTKLKDLYRFVALKNDFKNSERLDERDANFVSKEIYDYFSQKNNNVFKTKVKINAEELLSTVYFSNRLVQSYWNKEELQNTIRESLAKVKDICNEMEVTVNLLPVLDGWVVFVEENEKSILIDKALDLYGKEEKSYWGNKLLGSYYSRDSYSVDYNKKTLPKFALARIEDGKFDEVYFEYQGNEVKFKNQKELDKFLKSIRVEVPKK